MRWKQDKGIRNEYEYIYEVVKRKRMNEGINDAIEAHRMLFKELGK